MDDLLARHRKELRDLQARVTQKKKQASKKTRKGVNDECDRLEDELKAKQLAEIAGLNGDGGDVEVPANELADLTVHSDGEEGQAQANGTSDQTGSKTPDVERDEVAPAQGKKPNRQKARLAKRAAEQEELARQAAEEAKHQPDLKEQERERMNESMKTHGLQEKLIRADGHCLYSAIADQLAQLNIPLETAPGDQPAIAYKTVRAAAAEYIANHQDDFIPFLEEPLPEYIHKVRDTAEWGGQLELMALAKTYGVDINVLQDFGRVEKIESGRQGQERAIWLGYYKHGFGLGEHYNSLRKAGG
ncbi:hypothetical protein R9X50_00460200 [Acrodontium crateriforme]|uniref:OTU domain-containing protein n=1 Tax=Acrodontium crateriforme TaxID=150365 RepID=A0AAQ3M5M7_9PEZI|nr:hypothetical protein R9X50_00460200 [Acrodontium crateriforme]